MILMFKDVEQMIFNNKRSFLKIIFIIILIDICIFTIIGKIVIDKINKENYVDIELSQLISNKELLLDFTGEYIFPHILNFLNYGFVLYISVGALFVINIIILSNNYFELLGNKNFNFSKVKFLRGGISLLTLYILATSYNSMFNNKKLILLIVILYLILIFLLWKVSYRAGVLQIIPIILALLFSLIFFHVLEIWSFKLVFPFLFVIFIALEFIGFTISICIFLISMDFNYAERGKNILYWKIAKNKWKQKNRCWLIRKKDKKGKIYDILMGLRKSERRNELKEYIKFRNNTNLKLSLFLLITACIFMLVAVRFNIEKADIVVIFFTMLLTVRLFTRGFEISRAFYIDISDKGVKNSSLDGKERIVLAIKSIIETSITTAGVHICLYFKGQLNSPTLVFNIIEDIKQIIVIIGERLSAGLLNVSFPGEGIILISLTHFIQIIISVLLISLSISTYISRKSDDRYLEFYSDFSDGNKIYILEEIIHTDSGELLRKSIGTYQNEEQAINTWIIQSNNGLISLSEINERLRAIEEKKKWEEKIRAVYQ